MTVPTFRGVVPQWTVPDKIRKAREHAGLSQQELADRLSVTRTSVVNWERGHTRPLRVLLGLLAEVTGVDPDWLADEGSPMTIVRRNPASDGHITALIRDQQPGYSEIDNPITAMRRALGHGQRHPNKRAERTQS